MGKSRTPARKAFEQELCLRLHAEGHTNRAIADMLQDQNINISYSTVNRRIQEATELITLPKLDQARLMELARLEAIINTYGPKAADGDHKAADLVIKTVGLRAKLLGLDGGKPQPEKPDEPPRPVIDASVLAQKKAAMTVPVITEVSARTNGDES